MSRKNEGPRVDLYLSLGSNQGDRQALLRQALTALNRSYGRYEALSSVLETEPWGFESPHPFLNLCVRYSLPTRGLPPEQRCLEVLRRCKQIEQRLGRILAEEPVRPGEARRYADRPMDIDILFYGTHRIAHPRLQVPHPLMRERDFVLIPLREIIKAEQVTAFPEIFR